MNIYKLKTIKTGNRFGSCSECGISTSETDTLTRIKFDNQSSITLCQKCRNKLIQTLTTETE